METQEIIRQVGALSYLGIFGISFLANVVVPVPEEIVILALGYVVGTGHFNFWFMVPVVFLGALISDVAMFSLSLHGNKIVRGVYDKFFSKIVPIQQHTYEKHINKIIFFSRFLVNLRFLGPFLAGQARVSYKHFLKYHIPALAIYITFLIWAGGYFQNRIESIFSGVHTVKNVIFIAIGVVVLWSLGQGVKSFLLKFSKK